MAGGIDWFRWHHGTVTDQKFVVIAKKAGASVAEVVAVWACLLEAASMAPVRGNPGMPDFEAMDCALGIADGRAQAIYEQMAGRAMVQADGSLAAWSQRQVKRERDDDHSTDRAREHRAKQRQATPDSSDATPRNATQRQETPREEERRGEEEGIAKTGCADSSPSSQQSLIDSKPADANSVQTSQPKDDCPHQAVIALFHETLPSVRHVRDWTPARSSLLRSRWREDKKRQDLEWWRRFFAYVGESEFLMGRKTSPGRKPFELGLEWLLKPENFAKVREGAYHEPATEEAS